MANGNGPPIPYDPLPVAPEDVEAWLLDSVTVPPDVARKPFQLAPGAPTGTAGLLAPTPGVEQVASLPGHLYRPRGAYPLDLPLNRLPVAIPGGGSTVLVTWQRVPQGKLGVVHKLAYVMTAGALGDGTLYTQKNGAPVTPYMGVIGAIGTLEAPQECFIELDAGDVFSVLVVNTGGAPITVAVRSIGWFYGGGSAR